MHIGGFSLFSRTSSKHSFNIASWHNPKSLTWRWIISVSFTGWRRYVRLGVHRIGAWPGCVLYLPFTSLHLHVQRNMWLADIEARRVERARAAS